MAGETQVRGCCPLDCQDSCAWVATVRDGRVVRVQGARDHPITRGALCAKTNDYEARTYAPDRILHPLRRVGPKGSGEFERISWDEAIDVIGTRFEAIIAEHGPEALMPMNYLGSMGVLQRRALMRLFHALGATRFHGSVCGASGNVLADEGHPRGIDPEEMVESRFFLLWGANVLTTCHHQWHFIQQARKAHGARVVVIDPRRTRTAAASDEHVPVRPGTDAVLAAGLAHVMVKEGLADLDFARAAASDLDAYLAEVEAWTPERVEGVCGVPAETIVRLAREFGRARPALIRGGVALQQTANGEGVVRGLSALAVLGGHWKMPGGGLFIESNPVLDESRAARPDLLPRPSRSLDLARMGEHLTDARLDPPIKALMVWGANPAVTQSDAGRVRAGLARDDLFTVALEHFMTDTARYADVVLPSTTQLEHFDLQGAWGHHYVSVNHAAVPPVGESKPHSEVLRLLATRLRLTHPALHESDEAIAAATLPPGVDFAELKARGFIKSPPPRPALAAGAPRIRLAGSVAELPTLPAARMLQLLTPKSHNFMNSSFANMPRQRAAEKGPTLDMNPADAAVRGLRDGARVSVGNGRGKVHATLRVTADVREGVVSLPGKWWSLPAESGAVANLLTPSLWSPGGQPAYNDTFVEVADAA